MTINILFFGAWMLAVQFLLAPCVTIIAAAVWIVLLLGAFVTGVVVDAFSARREQRETALLDQRDVCFICGRHRSTFRTSAASFDDHVANRHYMSVPACTVALHCGLLASLNALVLCPGSRFGGTACTCRRSTMPISTTKATLSLRACRMWSYTPMNSCCKNVSTSSPLFAPMTTLATRQRTCITRRLTKSLTKPETCSLSVGEFPRCRLCEAMFHDGKVYFEIVLLSP